MKSLIYKSGVHLALLLITAAFAAFSTRKSNENSIGFTEAMSSGKITASGITNGMHSGPGIQLNLLNKTSAELKLMIPAGTLFIPEDPGEQTLMTTQDELLVLQPRTQNTATLTAYCTEAGDRCPSAGGKCSIGKVTDPKLNKLIAELRNYKVSGSVLQDAVWAVTNNYPVSNIDQLTPADKRLRTFIAELTGQKNVWYTTPQSRTVDNSGNIVSETLTIRGDIGYTASKGMMIYNEVVQEDGTRIHKTEAHAAPFNGRVEFTFTLRVKGWEKGKYHVRVKEGERLIADYPFSI